METTINSKRMEYKVTFAVEGATMQAEVKILDGAVAYIGGAVTNGEGQNIGYGSLNEYGQHTVTTANGGRPSQIGALLEQAQEWVGENLVEAAEEAEAEEEEPANEE